MPRPHLATSERATLHPFIIATGDAAPRDQRDLMERPFFSLAKSRRVTPILYEAGDVRVEVHPVAEHGMATIWDADILIWAASQIVEAETIGLTTSRFLRFTPYQLLLGVGRATGASDYRLLKDALVRLQSTAVRTTIRHDHRWRRHHFSWVNEWEELTTRDGRTEGMEMVLPDWFYRGIIDRSLVLTIDPAYFRLTGGIERWLYRVARKHAGRQPTGWRFELRHLHEKSGSLARFSDFALQLRRIALRQPLPGYRLLIERDERRELLLILPADPARGPVDKAVNPLGRSHASGHGRSHARLSGDHTHGSQLNLWSDTAIPARNTESNKESNILVAPGAVDSLCRGGEVSRTKARFRGLAPGNANRVHETGTDYCPEPFGFQAGPAAQQPSGGAQSTAQPVHEHGTPDDRFTNLEPTSFRQPIGKERFLRKPDSRNLEKR